MPLKHVSPLARRWVSLGGWCGPSLMLSKLQIRPMEEQLPFDMVRTSFDGVIHFATEGFNKDFFPSPLPPYEMDPASIWMLFRGTHTCITHFDINNPMIQARFHQKFQEWNAMVEKAERPVTFIRTSIAENPFAEVGLLPLFEETLMQKSSGKLSFRTIMVVHDQGAVTEKIAEPTPTSSVWNLAFDTSVPPTASLLDRTEAGYKKIITDCLEEREWERVHNAPLRHAPVECNKPSVELCTVEGVPAFRGSCKGIATTASVALGKCVFCGCDKGHPVAANKFDTGKSWNENDDQALIVTYGKLNDIVATCEEIGLAQKRSANEVYHRLLELLR